MTAVVCHTQLMTGGCMKWSHWRSQTNVTYVCWWCCIVLNPNHTMPTRQM